MNFELNDDQLAIQNAIRDFAKTEIAPNVKVYETNQAFPAELLRDLGDLGIMGITMPESLGGAGLGYIEYALIVEELSAVDPALGLTVAAHNSLGSNHIYMFGSELQRISYIPRLTSGKSLAAWALTEPGGGSDAFNMQCTARRGGSSWILNGAKTFITNPSYAEFCVVLAKTNPDMGKAGISAFVVERGTPGFSVGKPFDKMGMKASDTAELFFQECIVPHENLIGEEGQGYFDALKILDGGRISIAAMCVGIARGAFEHAVRYTQERSTFGKKLHQHQAIKMKLADISTRIDAARLLVMRAASMKDAGKNANLEAAMAKLYSSEVALQAADEAVQIFGGFGYIRDYPVEKYYRDAKLGTIGEGTSEIIRMVIARDIIKKYSLESETPAMVRNTFSHS